MARRIEQLSDGRVRLHGASSRKGIVVGLLLLLFGAVWTGFMWFPISHNWSDRGASKWFGILFIGLFVLVGVGALLLGILLIINSILVGQKIMAPVLTIDRQPLRLGERFKAAYEQQTRKDCAVNKVTLKLTCKEWVRYTVGTNTRTARHTVSEVEQVVLENTLAQPGCPITGEAEFKIAPEAMHSFDAPNNKVQWTLSVHTDIARWPDYTDELNIKVAPRLPAPAG